jgi:phosphoglucomutase
MSKDSLAYQIYQQWLQDPLMDEYTIEELRSIEGDYKDIEDRFYRELEFGTGGLRGVIGAGTNRMNLYTVGKATQGLAQYVLQSQFQAKPGRERAAEEQPESNHSVVIAYDSRNQSPEFALEAALVLAGNGIKAYVFESLRPTPELSFAVRALQASAGIVITASHNPPEYNGYKAYGSDGNQLLPEAAEQVIEQIRQIKDFSKVKKISKDEAEKAELLNSIGEEMDQQYIEAVVSTSLNQDAAANQNVKIVYTPLHGAGNKLVRQALQQIGCTQVHVVKEQEHPDAEFSTVRSPNPEEQEAFTLALKLAEEVDADIIMGTDPDCDRMGAVVRNDQGKFEILTGNQTGALLTHYLLNQLKDSGKLPDNGMVIKTIVTSELGARIAESCGVSSMDTLTGFKYIGEKISEFEQTGEHQFIFGYEESYGYLAGTHCRDKDAVVASMLICEAAAFYKKQGLSLYDVLQKIYQTHGYFLEKLESRTLKGVDGVAQINRIMEAFRVQAPADIAGIGVNKTKDYLQGIEDLPQENVLKYTLDDGSWFCLRPSGTEPKIKVYLGVVGSSSEQSQQKMQQIAAAVMKQLDQVS